MLTTVTCSARVAAPVELVFGLVADFRTAVQVIDGLESLSPIGPQHHGEGAAFHAVMNVGPKVVKVEIEITSVIENETITWASRGGDNRELCFFLEARGEVTHVRLSITYDGPDGLSGLVLAPVVEDMVRSKARETLTELTQLSASWS